MIINRIFHCCKVFLALGALVLTSAVQAAIPQAERDALINLYNSTGGPGWTNKAGWDTAIAGTECSWYGIVCDGAEGHVTDIVLIQNNLVGALPSIGDLSALRVFAVVYSQLTGSIPSLSNNIALEVFNVGHNQLTGSIPSLSNNPVLWYFEAGDNKLTGPIPSLSNNTALQHFGVDHNQLTGPIPSLSNNTALQWIAVNGNQLTGSIPSLSNNTALTDFIAEANLLSGSIPSLDNNPALLVFDVRWNALTGSIPSLSNNTALQRFLVQSNALTGNPPAAPSTLTIAEICPNFLSTPSASDAAWDAATPGGGPWSAGCTAPVPTLTIVKSSSSAIFTVGVPASYTLTVTNIGVTATTAVATVTDTIPAGLTLGAMPAGCTAAGQVATCVIAAGMVANGESSFVIPVTPTAAAVGSTLTSTASVSGGGDSTCPAVARCMASVSSSVMGGPVLTMSKTASSTMFTVGTPVTYTLKVTNTGTGATTVVATVTDNVPANLTLGTLPAGCTAAGQAVNCTVAAGLAAGGVSSFAIPAIPTAAAAGTTLTNTASVSGGGDTTCPAAAHCTSSVSNSVSAAPGVPALTMSKTASSATFTVGTPVTYTLTVTNTGIAATTAAATVTDTMPGNLTLGTMPAGCTAAGQVVTCTVAAGLAANAVSSFAIPVTPTAAAAGTTLTNTATVSGGGDTTCPGDTHCTSSVSNSVVTGSSIPTLSEYGLMILSALMLLGMAAEIKRKSRR